MKHVDPIKDVKNPPRRPNYWLVFALLAAMTVIEVAITYMPGIPLAPVLLTMSFLKAMLVILYFMHLRSDSKWFSFIFFAPFLLVIPLLIIARMYGTDGHGSLFCPAHPAWDDLLPGGSGCVPGWIDRLRPDAAVHASRQ